jgi:hypothetical protein
MEKKRKKKYPTQSQILSLFQNQENQYNNRMKISYISLSLKVKGPCHPNYLYIYRSSQTGLVIYIYSHRIHLMNHPNSRTKQSTPSKLQECYDKLIIQNIYRKHLQSLVHSFHVPDFLLYLCLPCKKIKIIRPIHIYQRTENNLRNSRGSSKNRELALFLDSCLNSIPSAQ